MQKKYKNSNKIIKHVADRPGHFEYKIFNKLKKLS